MRIQRNILFSALIFCSLLIKLFLLNAYLEKGLYSDSNVFNNGDASHYLQIAKNLNSSFQYTDTEGELTESATWRSPFWPFLLSLYMFLTSSFYWIAIVKVLFETIFILIILKVFLKKEKLEFFPFFLSLFILFEPQYLKYSVTFLSESITSILVLVLGIIFYLCIKNTKMNYLFPVIAALVVLSHPVSIFFVIFTFLYYIFNFLKSNFNKIIVHFFLFTLVLISWPVRNYIVFNKGFYLTASQGATFSKGWNEKVLNEFNNVNGDLADESLNLKYIEDSRIGDSFLQNSKMYKESTFQFLKNQKTTTIFKIAIKKVKSNFIPFPEKEKKGIIEMLGTFFRVLYLLLLTQAILVIYRNGFRSQKSIFPLLILFVYIGQTILAVFIYTGIRFNSIYGLLLLFAVIFINFELINRFKVKVSTYLKSVVFF